MHQKMAEDARKRLAAVLGGDAVDPAAVPLLRDSVAGAFPAFCLITWKSDVLKYDFWFYFHFSYGKWPGAHKSLAA